MRYKVSGVTHIGITREVNQDNYYIDGSYRNMEQDIVDIEIEVSESGQWIAAVFDGMGGEKDGEVASLLAAEATKRIVSENGAPYDIGAMIVVANDDICTEMATRKCSMGSTCVYLEFDDSRFRTWNIGDSRVYRIHNGELSQLTRDHTEAAYYASFLMDADINIGSANKLTQFLGISGNDFVVEPYVSEWVEVRENDLIIICSDGLTHHVNDDEISDVLKNRTQLHEKKDALLELALERGGSDNITFMLVEACNKVRY